MRLGLLHERQFPRPWTNGTEHRLFENALAEIELPDRLGIDGLCEVEHHFLEEHAFVPAAWRTRSVLRRPTRRSKRGGRLRSDGRASIAEMQH